MPMRFRPGADRPTGARSASTSGRGVGIAGYIWCQIPESAMLRLVLRPMLRGFGFRGLRFRGFVFRALVVRGGIRRGLVALDAARLVDRGKRLGKPGQRID